MNRKIKSNKKMLIIVLVTLLLVLAVGYAAFSDVLVVSGTANAKGTFNIEFQDAKVVTSAGVDLTKTKAVVSENKNDLSVVVADLSYPGAGVEFSVDIVNTGTISADITKVNRKDIKGSKNIKIKGLDVIDDDHKTLAPGEKCNIHFTVEWPESSTQALEKGNEEVKFELSIQYTQSEKNTVFKGNTVHIDEKK